MDFYSLNEEDAKYYLKRKGLLNILEEGDGSEIPPKWDDLARLYFLVRNRKPFQILEFGSGFSTIVMAKALKQFYIEYLSYNRGKNRKLIDEQPKLTSVESSEKWMKNTQKKVDRAGLGELVNIVCSTVTIKEYQGQVCHFYEKLPDIVPDFVYLDGPDPLTVKGSINGLTFQNPERTVMAADILLYETTITPGFFMIIDGRSNNARFLQRMLRRQYNVYYYQQADVTTFELNEQRLGEKNVFGWEAFDFD